MALPNPPNITQGQIALDPINGIVYYKDENNNLISTTWSWLQDNETQISTEDDVTISSNLTVGGDLIISGDTVSLNVAEVLIEDNILVLNSNVTSAPILNAGIEVERGTSDNVQIRWNESLDKWQFTNDGTTYLDLNSIAANSVTLGLHTVGDYVATLTAGTGVSISQISGEGATPSISIGQPVATTDTVTFAGVTAPLTGNVTGNITGDVIGNVTGNVIGQISSITNHGINQLNDVDATPSNGQFLKWNGTSWVNDAIDLTTDTVGDYTKNLVAGTGVTIANNSGEGSTPNISIGQAVGTTDTVTFNVVNADLTGDVTGTVSDISNHGISDLSDVNINDAADGNFLRYNGSNWFNDPVNLATDTVGDYISRLTGSNGITISNNSGEGATPNIAFSGSIDNLSDVAITSAANGQILEFNGTNWVNSVRPSNEPMGHEDKTESTISFNEGTRTFSIAPVSTSFTVWCAGKRFVKTGTETVQIPDTSGLYYVYYNTSGVLSYRTSYFVWDEDAPTAYVYWNEVDNKAYFFADERHGITLDWATHEYLHRTRGAAIANGFGANNYILNGDGSLDSHAKLDIADGTFFDEDLQVDITHSNTPASNTWQQIIQGNAEIPVFYRVNNHWKKDTATEFPLKQGTNRPQYNLDTAGTWSATDIANNRFGVSWIIATNNLNEPIIAVLGQGSYTDNGSAQAEFYSSLNLDGFPIVEFRPLYKIIYECKDSYTNTPSARITDVIDLRSIISSDQGVGATAVSDHGSMTGLTDDDHTQYLRTDGTRTATSLTVSGSITTNSFILDGIEIDAATPSDTNVLKYDAGLNKYVPGVASTVASLDDLTDVVIGSATPNQVLVYQENGTWAAGSAPIPSVEGSAYFSTIGDGTQTTFTITHNLATRDVFVSTTEANSPYSSFSTYWEATTDNSIILYFDSAPSASSVRVAIYAALAGSSFPDLEGTTYTGVIGNGVDDTIPVVHSLGTRDVFIQARQAASPYQVIAATWEVTTTNIVTFSFDTPPALDSVKVYIYSSVIGSPTTSLSGLTDVNYVNPDDNDILSWDEATSQWIPQAFIASVADINDIDNVVITSATPNNYLQYNGTQWVNSYIDLGANTSGNYVKNLVAGTGIAVTNNSGEGATPTIAITSLVVTTSDTGTVTSTMLANDTILNADVNSSAAIAYSKLNLNNSVDYTDLKDGVAKSSFRSTLNDQTGTTYTLALADLAKLVTLSNAGAITLTVPLESSVAFAIGDRIDLLQKGAGQVTIVGAGGVTVNATPGLKLRAQWSSATLIKLDTNSWVLLGDLQA